MLCRIVARSNADLQRVIDLIVGYDGIVRASTIIALAELIPYRVAAAWSDSLHLG